MSPHSILRLLLPDLVFLTFTLEYEQGQERPSPRDTYHLPGQLEMSDAWPATWRYVIGFLLVGCAWGLTTPFMRRAAVDQKPEPERPFLVDPSVPWVKRKSMGVAYAISDLLSNPAYAIPLLLNVTGSVWFFLLIGQAGMTTQLNKLNA